MGLLAWCCLLALATTVYFLGWFWVLDTASHVGVEAHHVIWHVLILLLHTCIAHRIIRIHIINTLKLHILNVNIATSMVILNQTTFIPRHRMPNIVFSLLLQIIHSLYYLPLLADTVLIGWLRLGCRDIFVGRGVSRRRSILVHHLPLLALIHCYLITIYFEWYLLLILNSNIIWIGLAGLYL